MNGFMIGLLWCYFSVVVLNDGVSTEMTGGRPVKDRVGLQGENGGIFLI